MRTATTTPHGLGHGPLQHLQEVHGQLYAQVLEKMGSTPLESMAAGQLIATRSSISYDDLMSLIYGHEQGLEGGEVGVHTLLNLLHRDTLEQLVVLHGGPASVVLCTHNEDVDRCNEVLLTALFPC